MASSFVSIKLYHHSVCHYERYVFNSTKTSPRKGHEWEMSVENSGIRDHQEDYVLSKGKYEEG